MQSVLVKQRYLVKIKRIVMVDFKIDFLKFDGFHPQACPLVSTVQMMMRDVSDEMFCFLKSLPCEATNHGNFFCPRAGARGFFSN